MKDEIAAGVVEAIVDAARTGHESGDGIVWTTPVFDVTHNRTGSKARGGRGRMTTKELAIATSTIWVVLAAILVMFMQAGFAFLEAGLTRMKNVGHIAAKNVLVLAIASLVYYVVGFGIAFGDGGNGLWGGSGFLPSVDELLTVGASPFSWFAAIPAAGGYLFEVVFCAVSLAIVWGAMAERTRLWVYFAFGVAYTLIYSLVSHWIWSPDGWLFARGMQDFAGSTVVHYQGALAGLAGALLLGPRIGKFAQDGKPNAIPGHNMAFTTLGVIILWFGWFGFNAGSTLSVDFGGVGFFAYVALNTNLAAAAGVIGAVVTSWLVIKKPDLSMMLNGAIAALVAITAACAFVAPWAAIVIGFGAGVIVVFGVLLVERIGIDDPVGALAAHGMAGRLGHALARLPHRAGALREARHRQGRPLLRRRAAPARHPGARARWPSARLRSPRRSASSGSSRSRSGSAPTRTWRPQAWTSPSTACGAIPSSTSRFRAATAPTRTATWASHTPHRSAPAVVQAARSSPGRVRAGWPQARRAGALPAADLLGTERTPEQELEFPLLLGRQREHVRRDDQQPVAAGPDHGQHPEQVARMADHGTAGGVEPRQPEPVAIVAARAHPSPQLAAEQAREEAVEIGRGRHHRSGRPGGPRRAVARVRQAPGRDSVPHRTLVTVEVRPFDRAGLEGRVGEPVGPRICRCSI